MTSANPGDTFNVSMSAFEYDFVMNETIILGVCSDSKNVKKKPTTVLEVTVFVD